MENQTSEICPVRAMEHKLRYKRILEHSFEEIYVFDARTLRFIDVSKGALNNLEYSIDEMRQMTPDDIKPALSESVFNSILAPLKKGTDDIAKFSTLHKRKDGSTYDVDVRLQYGGKEDPVFIAMVTDVTEQNARESELKALAFRDPGTDLYNKRYFLEHLHATINHVNRMHSSIGLLLIDMDDFSTVNNKFGHVMGDKIILDFAEKIDSVFSRKTDIVARFGGDEFVVMCVDSSYESLIKLSKKLIKLLNIPSHHNGIEIVQTGSIGICVCDGSTGNDITEDILIEGADKAMYKVKAIGKNNVRICDQ